MSMLFGLQNGNFTDQTKNKPKLVKNEKKLKTVLFLGKGGITLAAQGEAKKNTKKVQYTTLFKKNKIYSKKA